MNLIAFYFFAIILVSASLLVVSTKNPVHSVLFLILSFFASAGFFILLGAEFLALLLVIIYVGAVAILFLFVVMMLNIDDKPVKGSKFKKIFLAIIFSSVIIFEIYLVSISRNEINPISSSYKIIEEKENIKQIGSVLYTDFFIHFQISGLILLLAMMGAVILTHRKRKNVKSQKISEQLARSKKNSLKIVKVLTGKGV